jgi:hypothetical protein
MPGVGVVMVSSIACATFATWKRAAGIREPSHHDRHGHMRPAPLLLRAGSTRAAGRLDSWCGQARLLREASASMQVRSSASRSSHRRPGRGRLPISERPASATPRRRAGRRHGVRVHRGARAAVTMISRAAGAPVRRPVRRIGSRPWRAPTDHDARRSRGRSGRSRGVRPGGDHRQGRAAHLGRRWRRGGRRGVSGGIRVLLPARDHVRRDGRRAQPRGSRVVPAVLAFVGRCPRPRG